MTSELAPGAAVPATKPVSLGSALAMSAPTVLVPPLDLAERGVEATEVEPYDAGTEAAKGPTAATASAQISAMRAAGTTQKTVTVAVLAADAKAHNAVDAEPAHTVDVTAPGPTSGREAPASGEETTEADGGSAAAAAAPQGATLPANASRSAQAAEPPKAGEPPIAEPATAVEPAAAAAELTGLTAGADQIAALRAAVAARKSEIAARLTAVPTPEEPPASSASTVPPGADAAVDASQRPASNGPARANTPPPRYTPPARNTPPAKPPTTPGSAASALAAVAKIAAMRETSSADRTVPVTILPADSLPEDTPDAPPAAPAAAPTGRPDLTQPARRQEPRNWRDPADRSENAPPGWPTPSGWPAGQPQQGQPSIRADAGWSTSGTPFDQSAFSSTRDDSLPSRPLPRPHDATEGAEGPNRTVRSLIEPSQRPPLPVILAAGLLGLITAGFVVLAMFMATLGPAIVLFPLCGATLVGFLAVGLWRGARGANLVTLLLALICLGTGCSNLVTGAGGGALTAGPRILIGAALLVLLLGPPTTRRHFWS